MVAFQEKREEAEQKLVIELLSAIERSPTFTQRGLATEMGIALGLMNQYLKRFVTKGWVRAKQVSPKRVAYFLTPYGMAEKGMMVRDYLARSMAFFKEARVQSEELFQHCLDRKWYEVAVVQQGDLADIVLLVAKGLDIHVKVVSLSDDIDAFDAVIIADVQNPQGVYDILKRRVEPLRLLTLPLLHISCEDGDKGQFFYAAHTSESATLDPCRNAK